MKNKEPFLIPGGQKGVETKRRIEPMLSEKRYGEIHWTSGQTVRDLMQNHLDANAEEAVGKIIKDLSEELGFDLLGEKMINKIALEKLAGRLYLYSAYGEKFIPENKKDLEKSIIESLSNFGNQESDKEINFDKINKILSKEKEPALKFKLRDLAVSKKNKKSQKTSFWLDKEELLNNHEYQEMIANPYKGKPDIFRFQIEALTIKDEGEGFDMILASYYKSLKGGEEKEYLRGQYGEGAKMSDLDILRNDGFILRRSSYLSDQKGRKIKWQAFPGYQNEELVQKGIEQDLPEEMDKEKGTLTYVNIRKAKRNYQEEFLQNIDPRLKSAGLSANFLCFNPEGENYKYLSCYDSYDQSELTLGVNLSMPSDYQYVQGIRVGEAKNYREFLFSYDFLNKKVLQGRDRNLLNESRAESMIMNFWRENTNEELARVFLNRLFGQERFLVFKERYAFFNFLAEAMQSKEDSSPPIKNEEFFLWGKALKEELALKNNSKNIIISVSEKENFSFEDEMKLKNFEDKGFNIIVRNCFFSDHEVEYLNVYYQEENINIFLWQKIKEKIIKEEKQEKETRQAEEEKKEIFREILQKAWREIIKMREDLNLPVNTNYNSQFKIEIIPENLEIPRVFQNKSMIFANIGEDGMTYYRISDIFFDLLKDPEYQDFCLHYLIAFELKTFLMGGGSYDLKESQEFAVKMHYSSMLREEISQAGKSLEDLSLDSNSVIAKLIEEGRKESLQRKNKEINDGRIYRTLCAYNTSSRDFQNWLEENFKEGGVNQAFIKNGEMFFQNSNNSKRAFLEGNDFYCYDFGEKKEIKGSLEGKKHIRKFGEYKVYDLDNHYVVPFEFLEDTVLEFNFSEKRKESFYLFEGDIYQISDDDFKRYQYDLLSLRTSFFLGKNCLVWEKSRYSSNEEDLKNFTADFKKIKIKRVYFQDNGNEMKALQSIEKTAFSIEYGEKEWNNPSRIILDILQNHFDASMENQVSIDFKVLRSGKEEWIKEREVNNEDELIGIRIRDNGDGYLPHKIGHAGRSTKGNPLVSGKYGEGQKLVAAAALRNNLNLSYSSLGNYQSKKYRWIARAETQDQEIITRQKKVIDQRVVFNCDSQEVEVNPPYVSETVLELKPDDYGKENKIWDRIKEVISPQKKDNNGLSGLGRYALNLRPEQRENKICLGPVEILTNEQGNIYENGLFVAKDDRLLFSYNFPVISGNRERNVCNDNLLRKYLRYIVSDPLSEEYQDLILKEFKELHLLNKEEYLRVKPRHKEFLFLINDISPAARILWEKTFERVIGENYLVSYRREKISKNKYLVPQKIIYLDVPYIESWSRLFPTVSKYLDGYKTNEIEIGEENIRKIKKITASVAKELSSIIDDIFEKDNKFLAVILDRLSSVNRDALTWLISQMEYWQDAENQEGSVFVSAFDSQYSGIALSNKESRRIGLCLKLFEKTEYDLTKIKMIIQHELIHHFFNVGDCTPEFIALILKVAQGNKKLYS